MPQPGELHEEVLMNNTSGFISSSRARRVIADDDTLMAQMRIVARLDGHHSLFHWRTPLLASTSVSCATFRPRRLLFQRADNAALHRWMLRPAPAPTSRLAAAAAAGAITSSDDRFN